MAVLFGVFVQQMAAVVAFTIFSLMCWYYWSHRKILRVAWKMPTVVPALPVVGHGYFIVRGAEWFVNSTVKLIKNVIMSSSINKAVFWVGPYPMFMVADPDEIHTVLNSSKSFEKGFELLFLGPVLGNNMFTSPGSVWRVTRRHFNPLFHPRNLDLLFPMLNECGRDLVSALAQHVGRGLVDVQPLINPVTLKSTSKTLFGLEAQVDMESDSFKNFMKGAKRLTQLFAERFLKVYIWPEPVFRILYKNRIKQIEDECSGFITESIEACRKQFVKEGLDNKTTESSSNTENHNKRLEGHSSDDATTQVTLVSAFRILQENYPAFSEKDLHNEVWFNLTAGSETSRVTLSTCLLALATHPDIQEKLYAEIVAVTGPKDNDVTPEDIRAMPYLDQVLKETMRRFIIIPIVSRRVNEDLKLRDIIIPEGSYVAVLLFGVHFNPRLYPNPERFNPDHFSPENVAARGKNGFMPFSSGPRNCIGQNYSFMVMKTFLVHVLKRFRISTTVDIDSQTLIPAISLEFKEGYRIELEAR